MIEDNSLRGRDLLSLRDFTGEEIKVILDLAADLKDKQKNNLSHQYLKGKTLGMIFQKASTRTRVSFEAAMYHLGGYPLFLSAADLQLGRGESIPDTARVLSGYLDGIMIRTFAQKDVEELAKYADIPVLNGLTDLLHPCQILADLLTIREYWGGLKGLKLAYVGDGNNICHSLLFGCAKTGIHMRAACPEGYAPNPEITRLATEDARLSGGSIQVTANPVEAVTGAEIIITDVWASMGKEDEQSSRNKVFPPYQVNGKLTAHAAKDYIFLHCLPAHRGEEVTGEIIDGPHSVVWNEAENRLHTQKAALALLL